MTVMDGEAKSILTPPRILDRSLLLAIFLAAAVLIPRGIFIIHAQSPCFDDEYHLVRGVLFWQHGIASLERMELNDPPLGEAIVSVPAWLSGISPQGCKDLPERIRYEIAVWKSLLFLPALAVIFLWTRSVYSLQSAWLAWAMVLTEPTLAAHLPLPTVDVLGVEGIIFGCWALWRYAVDPTRVRLLVAVIAVALGLLIKHTAMLLPVAAVILIVTHWFIRLKLWHQPTVLRRYVRGFARGILLLPLFMWIFMLGNLSVPNDGAPGHPLFDSGIFHNVPLPCGLYLGSMTRGLAHAYQGHQAYLLGKIGAGWWYYFPVVATYKIPVGIGIVMLLGLASLFWIRPRYEETPLFIAALVWTAATMAQHINIGFRHFLPAEIFWIMLASRCLARHRLLPAVVAWSGLALAAIHVALWTPDDLSYINFPRQAVYLQINDSNIDWGQALKQLHQWMVSKPDEKRPIYLAYFGNTDINRYAPHDPPLILADGPMPNHGILVLSPVILTGQYGDDNRFAALRSILPREIIGHSLLVYDLDELYAAGKLH